MENDLQIPKAGDSVQQSITERKADYEMLNGLLIYHIEEGADRIKRAATRKAISIIDLIDDEALFALTISNLVVNWIAISPCCHEGLEWKEKVLRKAQYRNLPTNSKWIEHLELLGAVRNIPVSERKSMFDLETEKMNGYVCAGIKKTSSDYEKACALLQYIGFNPDYWLQENELVDGYVRLPISKKSEIKYMDLIPESKIRTFECVPSRKATSREIEVLNSIFQMYSKKKELKIEAEKQFRMQWNQHRFLCEVAQWWDNISAPFDITEAGRIVAHTNAHRLNLIE